MLVDTAGTDQWVGAGKALNGHGVGRSQLGTDIHGSTTPASPATCRRLLGNGVAGDAEGGGGPPRQDHRRDGADHKARISGDVAMTYLQWLALTSGCPSAPAAVPPAPKPRLAWLDVTGVDRFAAMLQRAEARLDAVDTDASKRAVRHGLRLLEDPDRAIRTAGALPRRRFRAASSRRLRRSSSAIADFGQPVNFVPVIDKDVRRWWRSDSLWRARDARYTADQVHHPRNRRRRGHHPRSTEPVGELLDRFEAAAVAGAGLRCRANLSPPLQVRSDVSGRWASCSARRTCCGPAAPPRQSGAPAGQPADWQFTIPRSATNPFTRIPPEVIGSDRVALRGCRLSGEPGSTSPSRCPRPWSTAVPVITADAAAAMRAVLAIAAGADSPGATRPW